MEKVVKLPEPVIREMIDVLQETVMLHPEHSALYIRQLTMLEMLEAGLGALPPGMTFDRTMEIYDQKVISMSEFGAVERWILNPLNHIHSRTARQFLGAMQKKVLYE